MSPKKLSNPFSTGGGGAHFEGHVQASFVTLMLTGGHTPCLPCWPITEIRLQGKVDGFDTDDLIVCVENPGSREQRKLLGQIKHTISITEGSAIFGEVIQAAWSDYKNQNLFKKGIDVICLMTGAMSRTDGDVVWLLHHARSNINNYARFFENVATAKFSSKNKQAKLDVFRHHLTVANNGVALDNKTLHEFLTHFYLLGYDLGEEEGVVLSLINSHISQYSPDNPRSIWSRILEFTNNRNHHAGHIAKSSLPKEFTDIFVSIPVQRIPEGLIKPEVTSTDWAKHPDATYLALVNLIGSWNENKASDCDVIVELLDISYEQWLQKAREVLQIHDSPLSLKNGVWKITQRLELWNALGSRLLDQNLDAFKILAVRVLTEKDPSFELPVEERYAANVHGKVMLHSDLLREGVAEGLALLGSHPNTMKYCSRGKAELIACLTLRGIFSDADWLLWGSINNLLPSLSEAAPSEFLEQVETVLRLTLCPFDELFAQESNGFGGRNYLTGLLWALEGLAWDEQYLIRVCVVLAELASHDPGERRGNSPIGSLATILLPWLPQTLASVEKRQTAVRTLLNEFPEISWNLLVRLLPSPHQTSLGAHKPRWRNTIPDSWEEKGVTHQEYWQQSVFYAELAVSAAEHQVDRLCVLIDHFDHLPEPAFSQLADELGSDEVTTLADDDKNRIWNRLKKLTTRHRRFSDVKWALSDALLTRLEQIAELLKPTDPFILYQRLFSVRDLDLYEEKGNWEAQREKLDKKREATIRDIFLKEGIEGVIHFADSVMATQQVGHALAALEKSAIDHRLLPDFLSTKENKHKSLITGYVWNRFRLGGWVWCDSLDKNEWTSQQLGQFLIYLPFAQETWSRVTQWLGKTEEDYWLHVNTNAYDAGDAITEGIKKLLEHGRPYAAINCLGTMHYSKQTIDIDLCVRALLAALSSQESSHAIDQYQITELIQLLQEDSSVDPDTLFRVEWAYLPLLDRYSGAEPKFIEHKLANDAEFFCELIRLIFRSQKEEKIQKEATEQEKAIATNAWRLLHDWKVVPGMQRDGIFNEESFKAWLQHVKDRCTESGHLEIALVHVGEVLIHAPSEEDLWINQAVATALNDREVDAMRDGFRTGIYNARGAHTVDPSGAPERKLAEKYRNQAEAVENKGFHRLAVTLRELADDYDRQAQRIIDEYGDRC